MKVRSMNVRWFENQVAKMESGTKFWLNAINCSVRSIESLRRMIKQGVLVVDEQELRNFIKPEALDKFRSGDSICPQMLYMKA